MQDTARANRIQSIYLQVNRGASDSKHCESGMGGLVENIGKTKSGAESMNTCDQRTVPIQLYPTSANRPP